MYLQRELLIDYDVHDGDYLLWVLQQLAVQRQRARVLHEVRAVQVEDEGASPDGRESHGTAQHRIRREKKKNSVLWSYDLSYLKRICN